MTPESERPDPEKWLGKNWGSEHWNRDDAVKVMREFRSACYRHAAAVAREEIRHADKLHAELGRLGENHYAKGVTDGRKDFAGKIAEVLERLATELEGEKP